MDHFTLSLAVGAVAGTLDIIPMIFQRLPLRSCLSAFFWMRCPISSQAVNSSE